MGVANVELTTKLKKVKSDKDKKLKDKKLKDDKKSKEDKKLKEDKKPKEGKKPKEDKKPKEEDKKSKEDKKLKKDKKVAPPVRVPVVPVSSKEILAKAAVSISSFSLILGLIYFLWKRRTPMAKCVIITIFYL